MTPREAALKVAALEALAEAAKKEYVQARAEAQDVFKSAALDGQPQQRVLLPSGESIGLITIKDGTPSVEITGDGLLAWCALHQPSAIEEYINPAALSNADVIAAVRDKVPEVVHERIRPDTYDELMKEIIGSCGYLTDKETGEKYKVADVSWNQPNGSFAFTDRAAGHRRQRIVEEWRAGRLAEIGFGPRVLTLEAGEPDAA
jgi:hypothetical protein